MILSVQKVGKRFGADIVLENVTFRIERGEKVALVGRNGTGKTTLLRIITGRQEPDGGSVSLAQGVRIGYLRQDAPVSAGKTVLEEAESSIEHLKMMRARLEELEANHQSSGNADDLDEYSMLLEHFSETEGYAVERDVRSVLLKMGFLEEEFDRPTDALSGGEKTRLALARMLLEEPDLLILDEPTNHLDLQATEWLETWVKGYHGAVLLVSHDRTFLENTAQRVMEIRNFSLKSYPGSFSKYLALRAEEDERLADLAAKQQAQIDKLDEYVRRFMNSQRTAQARGRQKQMFKLMEGQVSAPKSEKGMTGTFQKAERSGDIVLQANKLQVGFPDLTLIDGLDWTVRWQERWGVIGENGAGKSTLIKTLLGDIASLGGTVRVGSSLELAYFSQDTAQLDPDETPYDFIRDTCGIDAGPARDLLGKFLFSGDEVFQPIRTLSGGEKNKLVLASLTQLRPNLLVLDEPTNHLDMDSREALVEALADYSGTLVVISHDRWLLSRVTDNILDVRKAGAIVYSGGYDEYRRDQAKGSGVPTKQKAKVVRVEQVDPVPVFSPRELSKEIQRLRKSVSDTEELISRREDSLKETEQQLAEPPKDVDVVTLSHQYQRLTTELSEAMTEWERLSEELERLESLQGS